MSYWSVLCLLLVAVPSAAAQWTYDVDVSIEGPALVPVSDQVPFTVHWSVTCQAGAALGATPPSTWVMSLAWEAPDGVLASGANSHAIEAPDCALQQPATGSADLFLGASQLLPGLVATEFPLRATASWGGGLQGGSAEGSTPVRVVPDYAGRVEAKVPTKILQAEPGQTSRYEVVVTNFGNSVTVLDIVAEAPGLDVPSSWPAGGLEAGETRSLWLNYTHPEKGGWNNDQQGLRLTMTPRSGIDANKTGDPVIVNLLGRTRGVPGPAVPMLMLGVTALAALRRRD